MHCSHILSPIFQIRGIPMRRRSKNSGEGGLLNSSGRSNDEIVPIISRNCAAKIEVVDPLLPRMRKWAARNHFKFDFINKLLLKCQPDSLEMMKPSTDEVKWLRSLGVEDCDATMSSLISSEKLPLSFIKSVSHKNEALMGVSSVKMHYVKSNVEMVSLLFQHDNVSI